MSIMNSAQRVEGSVGMARRTFVAAGGAGLAALAAGGVPAPALAQETPAVPEASETCDVVVVGGGAAGVTAALVAAEEGLDVLLLEAEGALGGMGILSGGLLGCETHLQAEKGYEVPVNDLFAAWNEYNHSFSYAPLVRAIFSTSADAIRWMGDHGVELNVLEQSNQAAHAADPLKWQCYHMYRDYDGAAAFAALEQRLEEAGCPVVYGARMTGLATGSDGVVCGVVYIDADGEPVRVDARKVVLATGGFCGDEEMMVEVFGTRRLRGYAKASRGEGTRAAWAAGARRWNTASALMHAGLPLASGETIVNLAVSGLLEVDRTGRRFTDETVTSSTCLWANAHYSVGADPFILLDQATVDAFAANEVTLAPLNTDTIPPAEDTSGVQADLDACIAEGTVFKGETLEELAEAAGFDAEVLAQTVARYNELVAGGEDLDFGKDPAYLAYAVETGPFYALPCCVAVLSTTGGLFVDPAMRPLTEGMQPVENLYCVGSLASGAYYGSLPGYPDYEGAALCYAFTSGYIAGNEVARELRG